jgi:hypothetical protein
MKLVWKEVMERKGKKVNEMSNRKTLFLQFFLLSQGSVGKCPTEKRFIGCLYSTTETTDVVNCVVLVDWDWFHEKYSAISNHEK